jgi:hypothetical protein
MYIRAVRLEVGSGLIRYISPGLIMQRRSRPARRGTFRVARQISWNAVWRL